MSWWDQNGMKCSEVEEKNRHRNRGLQKTAVNENGGKKKAVWRNRPACRPEWLKIWNTRKQMPKILDLMPSTNSSLVAGDDEEAPLQGLGCHLPVSPPSNGKWAECLPRLKKSEVAQKEHTAHAGITQQRQLRLLKWRNSISGNNAEIYGPGGGRRRWKLRKEPGPRTPDKRLQKEDFGQPCLWFANKVQDNTGNEVLDNRKLHDSCPLRSIVECSAPSCMNIPFTGWFYLKNWPTVRIHAKCIL